MRVSGKGRHESVAAKLSQMLPETKPVLPRLAFAATDICAKRPNAVRILRQACGF
jgi:hypothetical protein